MKGKTGQDQKRVMWHVGTKDPVRPIAWDAGRVGECLTPAEPPTDQWLAPDGWSSGVGDGAAGAAKL